jgi:hypothetical protein
MDAWLSTRPKFPKQLYVVLKLKDGKKYEFFMGVEEARDTTMYIEGICRDSRGTTYLYKTKSDTIKSWFADSGVVRRKKRRSSNQRMHQTPDGAGDP